MQLQFATNTPIAPNSTIKIPLDQVQVPVSLTFTTAHTYAPGSLFTIIMRDPDAPYLNGYVHYFVVNSTLNTTNGETEVLPYVAPQRVDHHYVFELYLQESPITPMVAKAQDFDVDKFVRSHQLQLVSRTIVITTEPNIKYHGFVKGLTGPDAKYCTCNIEVEAKGTDVNPYAVCARSTGGHMASCGQYYDYEVMPLEYLLVFADRHQLVVPDRKSRRSVIDTIYKWKQDTGQT